jgi:hypothetical protein
MIVSRRRVALAGLLAAGSVALGGCAATRTVRGKVLSGEAGIATVVPSNDLRLEEPGVPGVRVWITDGSSGMGSVAEATSKGDGSFSLRVPEAAMTRRVDLHAGGDTVLEFSGSVLLPMDDRRLLVFIEPSSAPDAGGRSR